jgi:hypothetical protein
MRSIEHMNSSSIITHEKLSKWAGGLFSLQFVGVILAIDVFRILGLDWSNVITGIILYAPTAVALLFLFPAFLKTKHNHRTYICLWIVIYLMCVWFVVDTITSRNDPNQSAYDLNRPYLFVHGVVLAAFVGSFAATSWRSFALNFMKSTLVAGIFTCTFYLTTYHLNESTGRFGGATALQHAIIFSATVACAFAFLFLTSKGIYRSRIFTVPVLWALIVFLTTGILVSGTRAALLGVMVSGFIYFILVSKRDRVRRIIGVVSALAIIFVIAIHWVPDAAIQRVSQIESGGLNRRAQLIDLALVSFENHPFGKTREYMKALDGVDYAHEAFLQMILEVGVIGVPVLLVMVFFAVKGAIGFFRSDPVLSGFLIVLFYFILQSFSAGSAYNTEFWFSLFFLSALSRRNIVGVVPERHEIMTELNVR